MKGFKRAVIGAAVMAVCMSGLQPGSQVRASSLTAGGADLEVGVGDVETVDQARERVKLEIQDYCERQKGMTEDKATQDKLDEICKKYTDMAASRYSKDGLKQLGKDAKAKMDEALAAWQQTQGGAGGSGSGDGSTGGDGGSGQTGDYTEESAIKAIEDYAAIVLQDCYDRDAVEEIKNYAIQEINNRAGSWTSSGLAEFVSKTKARMEAYDYANYTEPEEEPELPAPTDYVQVGGNWVTPVATYGQRVSVVLPIVNMAKEDAYDVIVTPVLDADPEVWPFDIEQSSYTVKLDCLAGENVNPDAMARRQEITWNFRTREDVTSGYKKIGFLVQYTNSAGEKVNTTLSTYVEAVGAPGSGKGDATSTPRLIVTGFETNPAEVQAGDEFNLVIHMKNTSKRTDVSNVEFTLKAATEGTDENAVYEAFLPVAGSNTVFVDNIPKDGTTDISIDLKAKADLAQKPYVMNISMKYEDENLKEFTADSSVSIPVHQEARFEISEPDVMPNAIDVGSESNIMFSIYNTGKTTLYNVSVRFEGDSISGGEAFVGNISPGGTGQVDTMVMGQAPTMDDGLVKAVISYEDNETNKSETGKEFTLYVSEPVYDDIYMDYMPMEEETQSGPPAWAVVLIVLVLLAAAITAAVVIRRKKKAKAAALLEESLVDEALGGEEEPKTDEDKGE